MEAQIHVKEKIEPLLKRAQALIDAEAGVEHSPWCLRKTEIAALSATLALKEDWGIEKAIQKLAGSQKEPDQLGREA